MSRTAQSTGPDSDIVSGEFFDMKTFVRAQNIGAAATTSVLALGLVTALPERYEPVIARTEIAAIQLQAAVSTQIAALANAAATTTAPSGAATASAVGSASPQASATGGTDAVTAIATAAIALAATPLWYLAFPVTLPLSVIGGIAFFNFLNALPLGFGGGGQGDPITLSLIGALLGLGAFAVGPPAVAVSALSSLFSPSSISAAAALPSPSAAVAPATTPDSNTVAEQADGPASSVPPVAAIALEPNSPLTTDAVSAAATATAASGDDPLGAIARVAFNVVGALLSPIWYLAFPITQGLGSLYGYNPPFLDPSGIFSAFNTIGNFGKWLSFPFRLGEVLFPPSVPELAATQSAATARSVTSDTLVAAAPTEPVLAEAAQLSVPIASPNRRERGAAQRGTATAQPAAAATALTDVTPLSPATVAHLEKTPGSAVSEALNGSVATSDIAGTTADVDTPESASTATMSPSAESTRTTSRTLGAASGQDLDVPSRRAGFA